MNEKNEERERKLQEERDEQDQKCKRKSLVLTVKYTELSTPHMVSTYAKFQKCDGNTNSEPERKKSIEAGAGVSSGQGVTRHSTPDYKPDDDRGRGFHHRPRRQAPGAPARGEPRRPTGLARLGRNSCRPMDSAARWLVVCRNGPLAWPEGAVQVGQIPEALAPAVEECCGHTVARGTRGKTGEVAVDALRSPSSARAAGTFGDYSDAADWG